ncbi:MAG TPA: multiheme c-type cytochrome [Magnetospirillum sp.]|nr:multiheme c-type cytochrome [Magnetospirillum sp.]
MTPFRAALFALYVLWSGPAVSQALPADYWRQPLWPQGDAPVGWSPDERSLKPEDCGGCHRDKFEEWKTSLHARAFSPGLVGQLLSYDAEEAAACLRCHAPLAEQRQAFEAARIRGKAHRTDNQGLAAAGNSCGGCHVRDHRRFGPPQRHSGAVGHGDPAGSHGGVTRTADFEKSEFCAGCHQFPQDQAINGKPLENTVAEWRASPAAAEGKACQTCHMPDRKHLWRGIHDPDMVWGGLTPEFTAETGWARFRLTSTGVGHAFPTYVTPKVVMKAVALDHAGRPIGGSERGHVIQRRVEFVAGQWVERSDTRLAPGQSAVLEMAWPKSGRVRMWLEVYPDDFYDHQVYAPLSRTLPNESPVAGLIAEASRRAKGSRFRLFETQLRRPVAPN